MDQEKITIEEIIALIVEIRKKTEDFIESFRESILIDYDGEIAPAVYVKIGYFDDVNHTILIEDFNFKLNEDGEPELCEKALSKEQKEDADIILAMNRDAIKKILLHLDSNKDEYYIEDTNSPSLMHFEDTYKSAIIRGDSEKIVVSQLDGKDGVSLIYRINSNRFTVQDGFTEISIDTLKERFGECFVPGGKLYDLEESFKNAMVSRDNLPAIVKNHLKAKEKKLN